MDLSRKLPAWVTLHGFDLKTDLLPRSELMPSNLSFHHLSVFEPVPEQYTGKYDVVHIRFFTPVVQNGDPSVVVKCAMQMLSMIFLRAVRDFTNKQASRARRTSAMGRTRSEDENPRRIIRENYCYGSTHLRNQRRSKEDWE